MASPAGNGRPPGFPSRRIPATTSNPFSLEEFLIQVRTWAAGEPDIGAVALVGSYARGEARPDSDVDLVILSSASERYFRDTAWVGAFGEPIRRQIEDWGIVQSLRVRYASGLEVEFGFTDRSWGADPADQGTAQVIRSGLRVVHEVDGLLSSRLPRLG
jgi:predicted nucleotidyltransferase